MVKALPSEGTCGLYATDSIWEDHLSEDTTGAMNKEDLQLKRTFVAIWGSANDVLFLTHPNSDCGSFLTANADVYPQDPISDMHSFGIPSLTPSSRSSLCFISQEVEERDNERLVYGPLSCDQRSLKGITQTSSTLGGLDVYLKGQALSYTHLRQPVYSVLDFSTDFNFDPRCVVPGQNSSGDPCQFRRNINTSGSIVGERFSASWLTVELPTEKEIENMKRQPETTRPRGRRLRKRKRPSESSCLTAAKELASNETNGAEVTSSLEPQSCHILAPRNKGIFKGLLNIRNLKKPVEKGWIWVET